MIKHHHTLHLYLHPRAAYTPTCPGQVDINQASGWHHASQTFTQLPSSFLPPPCFISLSLSLISHIQEHTHVQGLPLPPSLSPHTPFSAMAGNSLLLYLEENREQMFPNKSQANKTCVCVKELVLSEVSVTTITPTSSMMSTAPHCCLPTFLA